MHRQCNRDGVNVGGTPAYRQPVSVFCEELGLSYAAVNFDDRLMERAYGRWEGLALDEIAARYPEDLEREASDRWTFAIPGGGESFAAVANRLRGWPHDLPGDGPVIVMAQGGSGRVPRGIHAGAEREAIFAFRIRHIAFRRMPAVFRRAT